MEAETATLLAAVIIGGVALLGHVWTRLAEIRNALADRIVANAEGLISHIGHGVAYDAIARSLGLTIEIPADGVISDINKFLFDRRRQLADEVSATDRELMTLVFRCSTSGFAPFRLESYVLSQWIMLGMSLLREREDELAFQALDAASSYIAQVSTFASRIRRWGPWITALCWHLTGRPKQLRHTLKGIGPIAEKIVKSDPDEDKGQSAAPNEGKT